LYKFELGFAVLQRCGECLFMYWHDVLTRLVGCPPFWHRKQLIMVRMIMEGKYSFASPEWDDISENAKDLVRW